MMFPNICYVIVLRKLYLSYFVCVLLLREIFLLKPQSKTVNKAPLGQNIAYLFGWCFLLFCSENVSEFRILFERLSFTQKLTIVMFCEYLYI